MPRLPVELTDLILASLDPLADARTHSACALAARALLWQTRRLRFATTTVDRASAATLLRLATAARVLACVRDLRVCDGPGTWTPSELGAFLAAFPAELRVRKLRLVGFRITDRLLAAVAATLGAIEHLCYDRCIAALDRTELVLLVWPFPALEVLTLKGMVLMLSPNVSAKNEEFMKLPRPHKLSKLSIHEHGDQDPFVPAFLESIMTHDLYRGIRHLCLDGSAGHHDETDKLAKFMSYVGPNLLSLALSLDDRETSGKDIALFVDAVHLIPTLCCQPTGRSLSETDRSSAPAPRSVNSPSSQHLSPSRPGCPPYSLRCPRPSPRSHSPSS